MSWGQGGATGITHSHSSGLLPARSQPHDPPLALGSESGPERPSVRGGCPKWWPGLPPDGDGQERVGDPLARHSLPGTRARPETAVLDAPQLPSLHRAEEGHPFADLGQTVHMALDTR